MPNAQYRCLGRLGLGIYVRQVCVYLFFLPLKARLSLGPQRGQGEISRVGTARGERRCSLQSPARIAQGTGGGAEATAETGARGPKYLLASAFDVPL